VNFRNVKSQTKDKAFEDIQLLPDREPALLLPPVVVKKNKFKRIFCNRYLGCMGIVVIILMIAGGIYYYPTYKKLKDLGLINNPGDLVNIVVDSVSNGDPEALKKLNNTNGKTNILLLGVDKRPNDNSYNTDTIMLMSYDNATNQVAQISFPRDLEVKFNVGSHEYETKINAVFPYTHNATHSLDDSFENLGHVIEKISGQPVHYGVMINFQGFKQIIDDMGGIDVDIENTFTDEKYPKDDDSGKQKVHFDKGIQHMDGATALKYARSRYAHELIENGDFARARRQQKVINIVKEKYLATNFFEKIDNLNKLIDTLGSNLTLYKIGPDVTRAVIQGRDVLKQIQMYSMVLDYNFGSFNSQLLGESKNASNQDIEFFKDKTYKDVRTLIQLYLKNPFLLNPDANIKVVCADPSRFNDYLKTKQVFWDKALKFDRKSPESCLPKPKAIPSPTLQSTISITPTTLITVTPKVKTFGTIYAETGKFDKNVNYYKELFAAENLILEVKPKSEMTEELKKVTPDDAIILALD
jgi:LCP family protein required for cell wall assembly